MTKLSCCLLALAAAQSCNAFVASGNARANDFRLEAKLEGRDIDGVLTPTNNFVLIKVADIQDETEGGILLTGSVSLQMSHLVCLPELVISIHYLSAILSTIYNIICSRNRSNMCSCNTNLQISNHRPKSKRRKEQ